MKTGSNDTIGEILPLNVTTLRYIETILYFSISSTGTAANVMLLYVLLCQNSLKVGEYLILNLAITDLATCTISIPFDVAEHLAGGFYFGSTLCFLVYPLQTILMAVSVITLLSMSLERRRIVIETFRPRILPKKAKLTICISWIVPITAVIPYAFVLRLDGANCLEKWDQQWHVKLFTLTYFAIFFVFPLSVIASCYLVAGKKLRDELKRLPKLLEGSERSRSEYIKKRTLQRRKVTKVFVNAVLAFFFCMLPTHLVWIWHDFFEGRESRHFKDILTFANVSMYLNSVLNPFIFRNVPGKSLTHLMACCCKVFVQTRSCASLLHEPDVLTENRSPELEMERENTIRVTRQSYIGTNQSCQELNGFLVNYETNV
ncbi:neuropeptide receptor npr-1-like [Montipora foliosa]|uniref:neuropeptide receptor npr-1-like n=1 Tax=Montipora foliosa TaxID=591990 RepID=UPI0035F1B313